MPRSGLSAEVSKLLEHESGEPTVVSLYLRVPKDPEGLRGLPARAGELLALAAIDRPDGGPAGAPSERAREPSMPPGEGEEASAPTRPSRIQEEDRRTIRTLLEQHGRDWLGHTVAIFVSAQLGLSEAFPTPCGLPDRAVLATRPHVRPLLVAGQRCPATLVVIIDRQHARVFRISGEAIETVAESAAQGVRSPGFGGWWGLDSYRIHERINQLAQHHFRDTASLLAQEMRADGPELVVVGGHEETIGQFIGTLPAPVRNRVAGSFVADPHTLTPARARALARPVIDEWGKAREERLLSEFLNEPPGRLNVSGLQACLTAVNQRAVHHLLIPVGGIVPGFACTVCGALSSDGNGCPDGRAAARPVPDLIEEMALATIEGGGEVDALHDPPAEVAAKLRFPLTPGGA